LPLPPLRVLRVERNAGSDHGGDAKADDYSLVSQGKPPVRNCNVLVKNLAALVRSLVGFGFGKRVGKAAKDEWRGLYTRLAF
jgi:hypothetical protein